MGTHQKLSALRTFPNLFGYACWSMFLSAVYPVNYTLMLDVRSAVINAASRLSMPVRAYKQILLPLCNGCLASLSLADLPHSFSAAICKVPDFVPHIHFCAHTSFISHPVFHQGYYATLRIPTAEHKMQQYCSLLWSQGHQLLSNNSPLSPHKGPPLMNHL